MRHPERMTIEAGGDTLRKLAEELDATHAPPFRTCFFDEYWDAIEQALDRLVNAD